MHLLHCCDEPLQSAINPASYLSQLSAIRKGPHVRKGSPIQQQDGKVFPHNDLTDLFIHIKATCRGAIVLK